jgi:hypothetical protein
MSIKIKEGIAMWERNVDNHMHFEKIRHRVGRDVLIFYDDLNFCTWYYLIDNNVTLAKLAHAFHKCDLSFIDSLVTKGTLKVHKNLKCIPGNDFNCIPYEDDVLFLEPAL